MWIGYRQEIRKLTFQALDPLWSEWIPSCNTPCRRSTTISLETYPFIPVGLIRGFINGSVMKCRDGHEYTFMAVGSDVFTGRETHVASVSPLLELILVFFVARVNRVAILIL